ADAMDARVVVEEAEVGVVRLGGEPAARGAEPDEGPELLRLGDVAVEAERHAEANEGVRVRARTAQEEHCTNEKCTRHATRVSDPARPARMKSPGVATGR